MNNKLYDASGSSDYLKKKKKKKIKILYAKKKEEGPLVMIKFFETIKKCLVG